MGGIEISARGVSLLTNNEVSLSFWPSTTNHFLPIYPTIHSSTAHVCILLPVSATLFQQLK
jgi:hypothetical protein